MSSSERRLNRGFENREETSVGPGEVLDIRIRKGYATRGSGSFLLEANFQVQPGFAVLVGPSGVGKSTMLRCIAGLINPDSGRITIGERVLFDSEQRISVEPARRRVAFVFQNLALFPHMTVEGNVGYGLRRMPGREREPRVAGILESFQIAHLRKLFPREISGGEQQRVALARCLVTEPDLLLLDEPLSSLDIRTKASIVEDLRRWNEAHRVPILYVTHSQEEMFALGEQVIVFDPGQVMAEGLPLEVIPGAAEISGEPSTDFENLLDATVVRMKDATGAMICRLSESTAEIEIPLTTAPLGSEIQLKIKSSDILVATAPPQLAGSTNVLRGTVSQIERIAGRIVAHVDCGGKLLLNMDSESLGNRPLQLSQDVWLIVNPRRCELVRIKRLRPLQRLVVFVCNKNTSRSPLAQAICNAEIARRLRLPLNALGQFPLRAVSAGLSATPGLPMSKSAKNALEALNLPYAEHRSQNLDPQLVAEADAIFCMDSQQREQLLSIYPQATEKTHLLDPTGELHDPAGEDAEAFVRLARHLQELLGAHLVEFGRLAGYVLEQ